MARYKPRESSFATVTEADLTTLRNVRVHELHFDERFVPYFTVTSNGETIKIRVKYSNIDTQEWIEAQGDTPLDVTFFPYKWETEHRSGVANYYIRAKVHIPEE